MTFGQAADLAAAMGQLVERGYLEEVDRKLATQLVNHTQPAVMAAAAAVGSAAAAGSAAPGAAPVVPAQARAWEGGEERQQASDPWSDAWSDTGSGRAARAPEQRPPGPPPRGRQGAARVPLGPAEPEALARLLHGLAVSEHRPPTPWLLAALDVLLAAAQVRGGCGVHLLLVAAQVRGRWGLHVLLAAVQVRGGWGLHGSVGVCATG